MYQNFVHTTLYLNITNACNMSCSYCNLGKGTTKASLSDMILATEKIKPSFLVITGGEPFLNVEPLLSYLTYYEIDYRKHWDIMICTSLLCDINTEVLDHIDDLQYTYSLERIKKINQTNMSFEERISLVRKHVRNIYSIITITEDLAEMQDEDKIKSYIEEALKYTDVLSLELLSYDKNIKDFDSYIEKADRFMSIAFKYIPKDKNGVTHTWDLYANSTLAINCNSCDIGCAYTMLPNGNIVKMCNCAIKRDPEGRKEKFMNLCSTCEFFKYCKANCERFGSKCGFPKITFSKYLKGEY